MDARLLFELGGLLLVTALVPNLNFFFPIRPTVLTILLAQDINWVAVGLVASIGGVIGVLPLYGIVYKSTDTKIVKRWLKIRWIHWTLTKLKDRIFLLIILLLITPLPDQLIGIAGGAERYPLGKFLLANMVGRMIFYLPLAYLASTHTAEIEDLWTWVLHLFTI